MSDQSPAAFARPRSADPEEFHNPETYHAQEGMSLRDYLVGKVLQGLAANPGGPWQANDVNGWALANCTLADVVEVAYQTADAALVERAK